MEEERERKRMAFFKCAPYPPPCQILPSLLLSSHPPPRSVTPLSYCPQSRGVTQSAVGCHGEISDALFVSLGSVRKNPDCFWVYAWTNSHSGADLSSVVNFVSAKCIWSIVSKKDNEDPLWLKALLARFQFYGLHSLLSFLLCFTHWVTPLVLITHFSISVGHLHLKWRPWPFLMILMDVISSCDLLLLLFTVTVIRSSHSQLFRMRTHSAFHPLRHRLMGSAGLIWTTLLWGRW